MRLCMYVYFNEYVCMYVCMYVYIYCILAAVDSLTCTCVWYGMKGMYVNANEPACTHDHLWLQHLHR